MSLTAEYLTPSGWSVGDDLPITIRNNQTTKELPPGPTTLPARWAKEDDPPHATGTPGPDVPPDGDRFSVAEITAASVLSVVGGFLLACGFFWLYSKNLFHRSNRRGGHPGSSTPFPVPFIKSTNERPLESRGVSRQPSTTPSEIRLDHYLLEPASDTIITDQVLTLSALIDQHVDNFYPVQRSTVSYNTLSNELKQIEYTGPAEMVAVACSRGNHREASLKHVISHVILRSVDIRFNEPISMLPAPVARFLSSIPKGQDNAGKKTFIIARFSLWTWFIFLLITDAQPSVEPVAFSQWRRLSAFLLHPSREHRDHLIPVKEEVIQQASILADRLNTFLRHFVGPDENDQRNQTMHLQQVIIESARLGCVLLSQPEEWHFVYSTIDSEMVVFPGLDKVRLSTRNGGRLEPRRKLDPTSVTLAGLDP